MLGKSVLALLLAGAGGCPRVDPGPPPAPVPDAALQPPAVASHEAAPAAPNPAALIPGPIDFATQVRPILEARCRPCHFAGGKMYAKLPFDQPVTIYLLGTRLFTRIQDAEERRLITAFLEQKDN